MGADLSALLEGHEARHSGYVGWGVDLAYARAVPAKHGGSIEVESSDDGGTTFAMALPVDTRAQ